MKQFRAFGTFWYDFEISDDWKLPVRICSGLRWTVITVHLLHVLA